MSAKCRKNIKEPWSELDLVKFIDELSSELENIDLVKFIEALHKYGIIGAVMRRDLNDVDPRVDKTLKVKYLLQVVCGSLLKDRLLYDSLLRVLKEFSIGRLIEAGTGNKPAEKLLTEQDIPILMNVLAIFAYRWEDIGVAMSISIAKLNDIGKEGSNKTKLYKVLNAWIVDGTFLKPVTLNTLKQVLAGPIVELPVIADKLSTNDSIPTFSELGVDQIQQSRILCQSTDTVVRYGMSTLLEVQVTSNKGVSYKWTKDGQLLSDNTSYQGTSSGVLLVIHRNMASRHIEGRYTCEVKGIGRSREISVVIEYPASIQYLLDRYSSLQEIPKDSWPPVRTESYVELALINKESDNLENYDFSVRGDMDDVLCQKEKTNYKECFEKYKSGTLLVVEGRPGVGKTTLAHKVTRDWSTGEKVLTGADLVFLISLRILNINHKNSLMGLLRKFYENLERSLIEMFNTLKGAKTCFILDGLDEYQSLNNSDDDIIYDLIRKKLSNAMIIVFSRPVGNKKLIKFGVESDKQIEIIGFKSEQINEYINKYFKKYNQKAEALIQYLEEHINVLHICYLPVHVAMMCYIYSHYEDGNTLNTETQIYERFTMLTIIRKLRRECNSKVSKQPTTFQKLSEKDKNYLMRICKLAFDMCVDSRQVFESTNNDILLSDESDSDEPSLGLVTVDSTARVFNYHDIYAFLHLTFQEYLAAYHIFSQTSDQQQLSIISQHKDNDAMLVVWKFYCGMMGRTGLTFHEQVQTIFSSKHADTLYRVHCAFESQQPAVCDAAIDREKQQNFLSYKNKIFTSGDCNAIRYVMSEASGPISKLAFYSCRLQENGVTRLIKTRNNILQQVNTFVFHSPEPALDQFQLVNCLLSRMQLLEVLDLYDTTLSQDSISKLAKNITLSHLKLLKIKVQIPFESHKQYFQDLNILTFNSQPKTVYYHMKGNTGKVDWYHSVLESVFSNSIIVHHDKLHRSKVANLSNLKLKKNLNLNIFASCTTFCFVNCSINDHTIITLSESLKNSNLVEKLVLDFNKICQGATALVSRCSNLKHLSIRYNSIDDEGAKSLAGALHKCSDLVHLDVEYNCFGDEGALAIASAVRHLNLLLYLWNTNMTKNGVDSVLDYVSSANIHFPQVCEFMEVNTKDPECFSRAIKSCTFVMSIKLLNAHNLSQECTEQLKMLRNLEQLHVESNYLTGRASKYSFVLFHCVGSFSNLKELVVSGNSIDSKGASALAEGLKFCTKLQLLDISNNSIGSKGAAALAHVLMKSCSNLRTLDISNNSIGSKGAAELAGVLKYCTNLQTLNICDNSIDSLGAVALSDGLKFCTNLHSLYIGQTSIGSKSAAELADVLKYCNDLQTLDICDNSLDSVGAVALANSLKFCTNLRTLCIGQTSIGSKGAAELADVLGYCTNLQTLDICENRIDSKGAIALAEGLKSCTNLQTLNINGNRIGSEGAAALVKSLKFCVNLTTICGKQIDSEGAAALAEGLKFCTNLQMLDISIGFEGATALADCLKSCTNLQILYISIVSESVAALADGLKYCTNLQALYISNNDIGSEGSAELADGLKFCSNLQTLYISNNNIGSESATALADVLKSCTYLRTLYISNNNISSEGAAALADVLKSCTDLEVLNISNNSIGSEGATALADGLKSCTDLQTLYISDNSIGSVGAAALAEGLKSCTNLQILDVSDNSIDSEGAAALAEDLKFCSNIQTLNISDNSIGSEGAAALADGLKDCINLKTLDISRNSIGSESAAALAEGLKYCAKLLTLDIRHNNISTEGAAALAESLKSCTNLQSLNTWPKQF